MTLKLTNSNFSGMKKNLNPLKNARERMGLSREQAAKLIDVHPMSFYFWERNEKTPKLKNLKKIKKVFNVEPSELLGI